MKIEGENSNIRPGLPELADRSERTASLPSGAAATPTSPARSDEVQPRVDQVQLSTDVQLVRAAIQTAIQLPPLRKDVVDRMRALVAQGAVGTDAARLGDAIIEAWLNTL